MDGSPRCRYGAHSAVLPAIRETVQSCSAAWGKLHQPASIYIECLLHGSANVRMAPYSRNHNFTRARPGGVIIGTRYAHARFYFFRMRHLAWFAPWHFALACSPLRSHVRAIATTQHRTAAFDSLHVDGALFCLKGFYNAVMERESIGLAQGRFVGVELKPCTWAM